MQGADSTITSHYFHIFCFLFIFFNKKKKKKKNNTLVLQACYTLTPQFHEFGNYWREELDVFS